MALIPEAIVEVRIGPPGALGLRIAKLYIDFDVKRVAGSTPNKASISIYNLSENHIRQIERPRQVVQLLAGDGIAGQLFFGDIAKRGVLTKQNGPDRVTTIKGADGRLIFREGVFSRSYSPGATRDQIITDISAAIGVTRGFTDQLEPVTFPTGWTFSGKARDALTELLEPDGVGWSIQDGALELVKFGNAKPGGAILISAATGMRGFPEQTDKGVTVRTKLDPRGKPNSVIVLDTKRLKGNYRAKAVNHKGNSRRTTWETEYKGVPR